MEERDIKMPSELAIKTLWAKINAIDIIAENMTIDEFERHKKALKKLSSQSIRIFELTDILQEYLPDES